MLRLGLPRVNGRPLRLLCLAAHPDDIEIGAGATVARLLADDPAASVRWATFSGTPERVLEATASATRLAGPGRDLQLHQFAFRDGFLPYHPVEAKEALLTVRDGFDPDIIISARPDDLHQDHAFLGALTGQVFRDHLVLAYEIAKTDGDLRTPNLYVPLEASEVEAKIDHLQRSFPSQATHPWFDPAAFRALLRLRGLEAQVDSGYAEAFHVSRLVL